MRVRIIVITMICVLYGQAQTPAKPQVPIPAKPVVTSTALPFYTVDDVTRLKVRDIEYKADQLEIEIQSMKVKIEEDKAAEGELWKSLQLIASQYAKDKVIDPDKYDFDARDIKFIKKAQQ